MEGIPMKLNRSLVAVALGAAVFASTSARASLTLTAAGTADGFSLDLFASGFPASSGLGPLGMSKTPDGNVIVFNYTNNTNYIFSDTNGQSPATALSHTSANGGVPAYALSNGAIWGSDQSGHLIKLNNNGTLAASYSNINVFNGLWTNPVTGKLMAAGNGLIEIDVSGAVPVARTVNAGAFSDGVTISPDGKTVYTSEVAGYNIATGAKVYGTFNVSGADGTGVISGGAFDGDIVVNSNFGDIWLLDALGHKTLIATGGTRGDYVAPDDANGTLFLSQTDSIYRLSIAGGSIGGVGAVPEPSTWALMILGFCSLGFVAHRRKVLSPA
jgi:hypothetical protein